MADVNLYPEEPKKVIGEYTEFFAGQLPTANDFNRWLAVLIAQGDYNTAWLDLVAQRAGISINELYTELAILSEIVTPGSGTIFSQRLTAVETAQGELETDLAELSTDVTEFETDVDLFIQGLNTLLGTANIAAIGDGTIRGAISALATELNRRSTSVDVTLLSTGWSTYTGGYYQNVSVASAKSDSYKTAEFGLKPAAPIPTATEEANDKLIVNANFTIDGAITFFAKAIPTANIVYTVRGL